MENRFFTPAMAEVLLQSAEWRLLSTAGGCDLLPTADPDHEAWMATHSHAHAHREVLVVLAGGRPFGWNGAVYPVGPGCVVALEPFEPHDLECPPETPPGVQLWLTLLGDQAVSRVVFLRPGHGVSHGPWRQVVTYQEAGLSAWPEADPALPAELRRVRLAAALELLLTALLARGYVGDDEDPPETFQRRVVRSVEQHIAATAGRGVSLSQLARIAGYSEYHFARLFKQQTGVTIHQYVNRCRRERLRQLTAAGHGRQVIAEELGFSCVSALARWERTGGAAVKEHRA